MKWSRPKLMLLATGTCVVVLVLLPWLQFQEPTFQSRPLSAWLEDAVAVPKPMVVERSDYFRRAHGEEAVVQIGRRAVPALIRFMRVRDSTLRPKLVAFCAQRPWLPVHFRPSADKLQEWGVRGAGLLGPVARAAEPELRLLLRSSHPHIRAGAAASLGKMGLIPAGAVGELTILLSDSDPKVRASTCRALGDLKRSENSATSALIQCLNDTNFLVFSAALTAAHRTGIEAARTLPPLRRQLTQADRRIRYDAATALGGCGKEAQAAFPELLRAVQDQDENVGNAAAGALFAIDLEAAVAAGILPPPVFSGEGNASSITVILTAAAAVEIYKTAADVELVLTAPGSTVRGLVYWRGTLAPNKTATFLQSLLLEQAGIGFERLDRKRTAVLIQFQR